MGSSNHLSYLKMIHRYYCEYSAGVITFSISTFSEVKVSTPLSL